MKKHTSVNLGNLLLSLSETMDIANPMIAQHQYRTAYISYEIAKNIGMEPQEIEKLFTAALLHDIGAVTVEEKISLHSFRAIDESIHPIRGEVLLEEIPWLRKVSKIVRNHHREWVDWDEGLDNPVVLSSQIILLADYIERLIDRNKYILHQNENIIGYIKKLENKVVNKKLIDSFIEISKREDLWMDLVSPRLYHFLLNYGPFSNIQIELDDISLISNLYRDLIDFKSRFTATHTSGVAECAVKLSEILGLADIDIKSIEIAGNFHDIGKLAIPNSIIEKQGRLTNEEYAIIKSHTYYTYSTLDSIGGLQRIAEWAAFHHENMDGSGYPFKCTEKEISTGSRIMKVADIFTALSEDRPYRLGMDKNEIYHIIKTQADDGFIDRHIVELLFDNFDSIYMQVKKRQAKARDFYEKRFLAIKKEASSSL
jgi:HD-GYP domain